jgi:hypothetical protein
MASPDDGAGWALSAPPEKERPEPVTCELDGTTGPKEPVHLSETGLEPEALADLALKMANMVPHFTTDWAVERLCLPRSIVSEILEQLVDEKQLEIRGHAGLMSYRYAITGQGHRRADRLMEISSYVGPAPVSLEAYVAMLEWHFARFPDVSAEDVTEAISDLVLPEEAAHIAGLAVSSGRSLFVYGPPGNGKTSLGRLVHRALRGDLWIPYCVGIGSHVIRVFDPQCHERIHEDQPSPPGERFDRRWIHIRRPFIVVGGELTLDALDLVHAYSRGLYEAPLHVKANGGVFLLDDFGCQHVAPHELVNRWIVPLEHQVDYLTLQTGQQFQVPFRQLLIISTNLNPVDVTTPGMLRRLGYRLYLGDPSPERYARIFAAYCAKNGIDAPSGLVSWLLERYRREGRPLRCCEPRDLIERARDICRYQGQPMALNTEVMDLAWKGYFSNQGPLQ